MTCQVCFHSQYVYMCVCVCVCVCVASEMMRHYLTVLCGFLGEWLALQMSGLFLLEHRYHYEPLLVFSDELLPQPVEDS